MRRDTPPPDADLAALLHRLAGEVRPLIATGRVATYIPALARVPADRFGMAVATLHGGEHVAGDADERFSIQSVSKVLALTLVLREVGAEGVWSRMGREPSGTPFNSLVQLEYEAGIPRNPFINAGALVMADLLVEHLPDPLGALLGLVADLVGEEVEVDAEVAASEAATAYRNRALLNLMRDFGNIHEPIDDVLDFYVHQCAITLTARQLARALRFLAADGTDPVTGRSVLSAVQARRVNAVMLTCGTYDAAGEFAFDVGIPCKSGVGGGIVGVVPDHLTVAVWSPALDDTGNSVAGRVALERFTTATGLSVF